MSEFQTTSRIAQQAVAALSENPQKSSPGQATRAAAKAVHGSQAERRLAATTDTREVTRRVENHSPLPQSRTAAVGAWRGMRPSAAAIGSGLAPAIIKAWLCRLGRDPASPIIKEKGNLFLLVRVPHYLLPKKAGFGPS
jgi:hypothetical protein